MTADPSEMVRAHFEAENAKDLDGAMAPFTGRCWYAIPTQAVQLAGIEAVRGHHASLFSAFPDLVNRDVVIYPTDSRVFARVTVERTHAGSWGPFEATGRRVITQALTEFPIAEDGMLEAEIVHVNPLDALAQIGAVQTTDVMALARAYANLRATTRP